MSKIQFRIGGSPGVVFNLPSKEIGDATVCVGKVSVDIYGLKCSESLSFSSDSLLKFCDGAEKIYESLKGQVSITSKCNLFALHVSAGSTGHIRVEVSMKKYQFTTPNNAEWIAKGSFYDNPECLVKLIGSADDIKS